eukprot:scaffold50399_cov86-Phaeocystis_antarctica.AAC.3
MVVHPGQQEALRAFLGVEWWSGVLLEWDAPAAPGAAHGLRWTSHLGLQTGCLRSPSRSPCCPVNGSSRGAAGHPASGGGAVPRSGTAACGRGPQQYAKGVRDCAAALGAAQRHRWGGRCRAAAPTAAWALGRAQRRAAMGAAQRGAGSKATVLAFHQPQNYVTSAEPPAPYYTRNDHVTCSRTASKATGASP